MARVSQEGDDDVGDVGERGVEVGADLDVARARAA